MRLTAPCAGRVCSLIVLTACLIPAPAALAGTPGYDTDRYMSPDELRPGMKGYGRTVMSGSKIETFEIEVIDIMRNAYYARQDVILVRCSGLKLEHSGIIGGMSGSPCFIKDDTGRERMIGAIAYGWSFNKDPIAGVQPITQMLPIPSFRMPQDRKPDEKPPSTAPATRVASGRGTGLPLGEVIGRTWHEPLPEGSRFSVLSDDIARVAPRSEDFASDGQLRPLLTPVMVSGAGEQTMRLLKSRFARLGLEPVASGGVTAATRQASAGVKLEPGSVLCIPFMTGDVMMEGLGTCTEVMGDRVLGFGHSMFGEGSVSLPLATGVVHTVIPSVMRSNKIGAALEIVGTLYGDENSGIFGLRGRPPRMVPVDVSVQDLRGRREYHYQSVHDENFTPTLLATATMESIFAHNDPPREHTIRYSIETEFDGLGTYRTSNFTSQTGAFNVGSDLALPVSSMMSAPFAKATVSRARVSVTIEPEAHTAVVDQARLDKTAYKPGESVSVQIRWRRYRQEPLFVSESYEFKLPADLPDGDYTLQVGSSSSYLSGLRSRKPHLFRVKSLPEMLEGLNLIGSVADNRLYMTLDLPTGGVAVDRRELPQLPSFRRQILASTQRKDLSRYSDALTVEKEMHFAVNGSASLKVTVSRRADQ